MIFSSSVMLTLILIVLKLMGVTAMPWVMVCLSLFFIPWLVLGLEVLVMSLVDTIEELTDE